MKRYGVEKLLVDERTRVKEKRRRTPSPDKVIYVHHREYIVIDEWSEDVEKAKLEGQNPAEDDEVIPPFIGMFGLGITVKPNHDKTASCPAAKASSKRVFF